MKNIFITGATSGIGQVAACELAVHGNRVFAAARNAERGDDLLAHYQANYLQGRGSIEIIICDLSSFESIVHACDELKRKINSLDVLINNAGIWNFSYKESKNKIEETFHVNVLAPLLLNHLLTDLLAQSQDARTIFASSALHQGKVDFANLEYKTNFSGFQAYSQSKLEIILLCRILAKKFNRLNIGVYCEHPGLVSTQLGRDAKWFSVLFFKLMGISPEKGAQTLIYLAEENKSHLVSGEYYTKKAVKKTTPQSNDLKVAQSLLDALKLYLEPYLVSPSTIFDKSIRLPETMPQ